MCGVVVEEHVRLVLHGSHRVTCVGASSFLLLCWFSSDCSLQLSQLRFESVSVSAFQLACEAHAFLVLELFNFLCLLGHEFVSFGFDLLLEVDVFSFELVHLVFELVSLVIGVLHSGFCFREF